jgi:Homeodomain-like domain
MKSSLVNKRRHGKIVKRAAEALGCSRRTVYNIIAAKSGKAIAHRLRCIAPADRPEIALQIETLARVFEQEASR